MRHLIGIFALAAAAAALSVTGTARAQVTSIDGSLHDLGALAGSGTDEICVYCHTPHGANNANVEAPLWNRAAGAGSYDTYDSTTIDGTILAVGSVSLACLSCHDGTQARDTVINAPGSGGYTPTTGGTIPGGTLGQMPAGIANLGTDLRNDHPIGIQYGGFTPTGATAQIDPDFVVPESATIGTGLRYWVDTDLTGGTRDKTDMILYVRDNGGNDEPFVECASCHDPHEPENGTFLRIANANSAVCLACHVK